jgi:hypothetical protein
MPRVPIVTAPRTVKPSIFVAPLKMMPVLLAPKIPVAPTTTVLKPSVLTAPAMSPTTPSVSIPSGATTGTSLVPSMSSGAPVEVGTIDKPKLSVGLIGLGLLALFLLSQDRR